MKIITSWKVYIHTTPNNKYYIGITSRDVEKRWQKGTGYVNNPYFYNSILKYGWDNIQHEIVAENLTMQEAANFEMILISKLKSNNSKSGYNLSPGGEKGCGASIKTKHKMSELKLYNFYKDKQILQLDVKTFNEIAIWDSVYQINECLNFKIKLILDVCRAKRANYKNYYWLIINNNERINRYYNVPLGTELYNHTKNIEVTYEGQ